MKLTRVEKLLILLEFAIESIQEICGKIFANKTLRASACVFFAFFILAIPLFTIFSFQPNAQLALPACSSLASNVTPDPGNNCLFYEGRPLCRNVANPIHRVNCADLIDLPLCSDIVISGGNNANPGRNCVNLCSSAAYNDPDPAADPSLVRGTDYAIFNKDCVRFCDDVEAGISPNRNVNCVSRKCHQLLPGVAPASTGSGLNCEILACNLLTPDELNKTKFDDSTKKYCEGDNLKCYNFAQSQLPYMRLRVTNPTCKVHDCTPSSPACGASDVLNITNQGGIYTWIYEQYINGGFSIDSNAICNPVLCREIIKSQYRCLNSSGNISGLDSDDNFRNSSCDASGPGSVCTSNYCYETIDCNVAANQGRIECQQAANIPPTVGDPFNSWFYRPKPLNKAINTNTGVLNPMDPGLCSHKDQIDPRFDGVGPGEHIRFSVGLFDIDLGYYCDYLRFPTASPPPCNVNSLGNRGIGYGYLCGDGGLVTNKASVVHQAVDYGSAYFKGYATTDFSGTYPKHKVTVCVRFKNTMTLNACGARECGISAFGDHINAQTCGSDVCQELTISESNEKECLMSGGGGMRGDCSETIDIYQRVRAVKYGDRICAFFDSKGQVAYNGSFFDGSETLNDGVTCINDISSTGNCGGYNSNSTQAQADVWRTSLKVHYIDNNRPGSPPAAQRGYLDYDGKLYKEQECPKVTLRIPPPDLYNLGIISNSEKLFAPPLHIRASTMIRGGSDAIAAPGDTYGITDFHYPEMKIQFGGNTYKMSLGLGYQGNDASSENYIASPSTQNIFTNFNGRDYVAELYVAKEYNANSGWPEFCLYRKFKNPNGIYLPPVRVGCVKRNHPDIDNAVARNFDATLSVRKTVVAPVAGNQYNNAQIAIKYLAGFGANTVNNNCSGDDICADAIILNNPDYKVSNCARDVENYEVCVQREECSRLNIECVQNEIDYRNAELAGQDASPFQAIRNNCNNTTLPFCNSKKGISTSFDLTIYNSDPNAPTADSRYYGWFNEMCVVSGFKDRLVNVIANVTGNSFLGKCFINPNSPYLKDNNPATNCDAGGFAPNCLCLEAVDGYVTNMGEVVRKQTLREAGLCIDVPLPQFCSAINHNPNPNSDVTDIDYSLSSVGKMSYNNNGGINLSHQYRSFGKVAPDAILIAGHAEFAKALIGVPDVRGECHGFWTYSANSSGVPLLPILSCLNNAGNAAWESDVRNSCVRYSCQEAKTFGPAANGVYQGNYGVNEVGESKGLSNGFAMWNKFTKTNDFVENANAISCIPGFKPTGSSMALNSQGVITGYSGGTLPTRSCDQLGNWLTTNNNCQRIQCGAINPRTPTSSSDSAAWNAWYASGGATFPAVNASRSASRTQTESVSVGTCNNNLGFFQSPGGLPPTAQCDSFGNWLAVKNPCVTNCGAISSDAEASSLNNGFSKWNAVIGAVGANGVEGSFTGCVMGYVTNPYPPLQDINGNPLSPEIANNLTRAAENPKRMCTLGVTASGVSASVWANVVNGCINQCPGADVDSRIGVGVTQHPTSGGTANIEWPSTNLNQYAYVTNWDGLETLFDASYFFQGRVNNYYLLRRYCNANGQWSDPQPTCSANNGLIGNAKYLTPAASTGYKNSIAVGDTSTSANGTCNSGFWNYNNNTSSAPQRQCLYSAGNQYIDKVYLGLSGGTKDCEAVTCPVVPYAAYDRVAFASVTRKPLNAQLQGTCLNNAANASGVVMYANLDPASVPPTINCQENGTWSAVQNETNCKRGCDAPGMWIGSIDVGDCGGGSEGWYYTEPHTLAHGTTYTFAATDNCGGTSKYWYYGEKCDDGLLSINSNSQSINGGSLTINSYNYATNNFTGPLITINAIWKGPVATQSTWTDKKGNVSSQFWQGGWWGYNNCGPVCYFQD